MADTAPAQDAPRQEEDARKVNLVSMDGDSFEVSRSVASMSELVKTLISGTFLRDGALRVFRVIFVWRRVRMVARFLLLCLCALYCADMSVRVSVY